MMKFKVGNKVTITRASTKDEDYDSWNTQWCSEMNKYIGTMQTINHLNVLFNSCRFENMWSWNFPLFVLRRKEEQLLFEFMYDEA